jgi:hypothetical protein
MSTLSFRRRIKVGPGIWRNLSWSAKRGMKTSTTFRDAGVTTTMSPKTGMTSRVNLGGGWFVRQRLSGSGSRSRHAGRSKKGWGTAAVLGLLAAVALALL